VREVALGDTLTYSLVRWVTVLFFAMAGVAAYRLFHHAGIEQQAMVLFVYLAAVMVAIAFLMDYPRMRRQPRISQQAAELERRHLLVVTSFVADRAFCVHESADEEGPHYFLELEDGTILHLSGGYLYEYEPAASAPRHFPCTHFTVRRHAETGQVVDLLCGGIVIEPEIEAPPFSRRDRARGLVPADGAILSDIGFDELREQRSVLRFRLH
jgi:hypothetical protein